MIAIRERHGKDADHRFAEPPWDEHDLRWQEIDQSLPADHLARQIDQAVAELDLAGVFATYTGRGSKALWPDLLLTVGALRNATGSAKSSGMVSGCEGERTFAVAVVWREAFANRPVRVFGSTGAIFG